LGSLFVQGVINREPAISLIVLNSSVVLKNERRMVYKNDISIIKCKKVNLKRRRILFLGNVNAYKTI